MFKKQSDPRFKEGGGKKGERGDMRIINLWIYSHMVTVTGSGLGSTEARNAMLDPRWMSESLVLEVGWEEEEWGLKQVL